MKTAEEAAKEKFPSVPFEIDENQTIDLSIVKRNIFIEGYNYRESFVAAEREEAVNEYKEGLIKKLTTWKVAHSIALLPSDAKMISDVIELIKKK